MFGSGLFVIPQSLYSVAFKVLYFSGLLQNRIWQRDCRDLRALQPDASYNHLVSLQCLCVEMLKSLLRLFPTELRQSLSSVFDKLVILW